MYKYLKLMIFSVLVVAFTVNLYSQKNKPLKIGIVNVEEIVKVIPEATEADKKLQEMNLKYRDSLAALEKMFVEKAEAYQKQKGMMNPEQQKKEEAALQKIQLDYQQFQQEKFGAQGELAKYREELLAPIREKVREAIQKVAKEEGMNFVLDKASPVLLYAEEKFDITYRVLDLIKRGSE